MSGNRVDGVNAARSEAYLAGLAAGRAAAEAHVAEQLREASGIPAAYFVDVEQRLATAEAQVAELRAALDDARRMALSGAGRSHLDRAGVMQQPPHGDGPFAECRAPWCVRNQGRLAAFDAILAATKDTE